MEGGPGDGPLTFLMIDMVGSTRSWEDAPVPTAEVVLTFRRLCSVIVQEPSCVDHRDMGDGLFAVFSNPTTAASGAVQIASGVQAHPWTSSTPTFRMGIYTGRPYSAGDGNYGQPANRCQRLMEVANGGQILADDSTVAGLPSQFERRFLGMHRLRDLKQAEPVYQLSDGDFPPILSLDARTRRLPKLRTETVGRTNDIREVTDAIERTTVITLIGPGGVGKTRLALEVAAEATLRYARNILTDGLCFCDLAPITDPATLPELVGASLELPRRRDQTIVDSIIDHLRHRRTLLLLDNCEHLVEPCADLVSMLTARCPGTIVLMTSRSPLGLPQERLYTVAPMRVPPKQPRGTSIEDHESVRLFLARARDVNPELPVDTASMEAIAEICRRCDGLPLAIELIASRCRALTPREILDALEDEQVILPRTRPSAFERQRTIENAVAWSYELLDSEARALLDVASVFAPEFDLAALRFVGADLVEPAHAARVVSHLVDMSMLESHPGPHGSRFRALETIRLFGWAKLQTAGRVTTAAERHADHYLALARQAALGMWTADEATWSERLALDLPNLRDAAATSRASGHWDAALGIPCAMRNFAHYSGRYEVFSWTEEAAWAARRSEHPLLAEAFGNAGFGRWLRNDLTGAKALAEEGLAVEQELACPPSRQVRQTLMAAALYSGDVAGAVHWGGETLAVSEDGGVPWLRSMARSVLAIIEFFHDLDYALRLARDGLAMAEELGNPTACCHALFAIATVSASDDPAGAEDALARCVALSDEVGNQWTAGMSRVALLRAQSTSSDHALVLGNARDLLRHWLDVGDWAQVWTTLQLVAAVLAERGRDVDAVTVEAALVRAGAGEGFYQDPLSQAHAAAVAAARQRLSPEDAAWAREHGERLSEREVAERVLSIIDAELLVVAN